MKTLPFPIHLRTSAALALSLVASATSTVHAQAAAGVSGSVVLMVAVQPSLTIRAITAPVAAAQRGSAVSASLGIDVEGNVRHTLAVRLSPALRAYPEGAHVRILV